MGEASGLARAVRSLSPVVGVGLVRNNNFRLFSETAEFAGTLLGPEATPVLSWPCGAGSGGVAPSWWWGVVFV